MKRRERVEFLVRDRDGDKPDFRAVRWVSKYVEGSYFKCFCNIVAVLVGLNPCATSLLFFLTTQMNERNYVRNTTELKQKFNDAIKDVRSKGFSDTAINRAFKLMTERKVLYRLHKKRGLYKVNPLYFFYGEKEERIREIRIDMERANIKLINAYRADTYEADMKKKLSDETGDIKKDLPDGKAE